VLNAASRLPHVAAVTQANAAIIWSAEGAAKEVEVNHHNHANMSGPEVSKHDIEQSFANALVNPLRLLVMQPLCAERLQRMLHPCNGCNAPAGAG
jgi:hypothetical protein